jgi:hypothetical protein
MGITEPLDVLSPSCYDRVDDYVDNIDEFIHIGKHKWHVIGYDGDPIYDIEVNFQNFPLQLSYEITNSFDIWQQGDGMITKKIQIPKDDLVTCSCNDFQSYLEDFDDYSFEHLDLFHEEYYQPSFRLDIDKGEFISFLEKDPYDNVFQLHLTI